MIFALIQTASLHAETGAGYFTGLDTLAPVDRYRQLSLILMVSSGVDDRLIEVLDERLAGQSGSANGAAFNFDDYTTPLIRIVDQETMLTGATELFIFTRSHAEGIAQRLKALLDQHPEVVRAMPEGSIGEDAIIIRNAIADSIDYAEFSGQRKPDEASLSQHYRAQTIYLRNNLEYALFATELDRITREAVASVGGQTEAYERMFDDEVDGAALSKKIEAAESVYGWDPDLDERAAKMAEEILENIWDRESDLDPSKN